ncbi:MAG: hypothetical protein KI792_08615 [Alphaproteobacteria bacterium]|nr:hypothetical protein [Alphaproteobacteria bacterium SS10]
MIVCHCNVIHCHEIRGATQTAMDAGADGLSAGKVFRSLDKKPNCARCVPLMTSVIEDTKANGARHCGGCPCPTEQDLAAPAAEVVAKQTAG